MEFFGPSTLGWAKSIFQLIEDNFISSLGLAVGLQLLYGTCDMFDVKLFIKLDKSSVMEEGQAQPSMKGKSQVKSV